MAFCPPIIIICHILSDPHPPLYHQKSYIGLPPPPPYLYDVIYERPLIQKTSFYTFLDYQNINCFLLLLLNEFRKRSGVCTIMVGSKWKWKKKIEHKLRIWQSKNYKFHLFSTCSSLFLHFFFTCSSLVLHCSSLFLHFFFNCFSLVAKLSSSWKL